MEKYLTLAITDCHHTASLVITNGDPREGIFNSIPTLMIYSYKLNQCNQNGNMYCFNVVVGDGCGYYMSRTYWTKVESKIITFAS